MNLGDAIYNGVNKLLECKIIPNYSVCNVCELSSDILDTLINTHGIKGLILDVDETIRYNGGEVPSQIDMWLDMISDKFKVIALSNGFDYNIKYYLMEKNIDYIPLAHKPLKNNFIKACDMLNLNPNEVATIGDNIFDDIYGGQKLNMYTIYITNEKEKIKRLK